IHYLTNNFSSSLPVFVFSSWFSSVEVGLYSLGFMMINRPMNLITSSFTQVFSQRVIEKFNKDQEIFPDVKALTLRLGLVSLFPFILAGVFGPVLFDFVFGDEWHEAGRYMRILLPWLFVVFISSPLSFLPDMLGKQKKAMWIDLIKFIFRVIALGIGVIMNDIYLSLMLFSGISFILVAYNLYWYVNLSSEADKKKHL
ncbi:MAG: oligosaccharide flippase family protein, partial [Bacteroidales bacterium]|nr:oligosaccharide flippase family protein [Bacteroidales bacterium]